MTAPRVNDVRNIGPDLVHARDVEGVAWKVLMRRYDRGRTWLYLLYRETKAEKERLERQKMFSEHLRSGQSNPRSLLNG